MEDYHYKAIINNIFRCMHASPLKALKDLSNEKILIQICMEMNERSFVFINDCIKNNMKDCLNDIINKINHDLEIVVTQNDINKKCKIDIKKLLFYNKKELIHLSQLLIVYSLLLADKKLVYIKTVKTCFNHTLRKNIYLIVNYYMKPEIETLKLCEEENSKEDEELDNMDSNDEEEFTKKKTDDPKIQQKQQKIIEVRNLEKEIENKANILTNKIGDINTKIQSNNDFMEKNIQKLGKFTKTKNENFQVGGTNKNGKAKRKLSMSLIKEKEKAIQALESKISNIQKEYKDYKENKEKEIKDMKSKVDVLLDKVNLLEKKKVLFKDYNDLKEKSSKYDELIVKYQRLKKIVDEKWDLTEQQYLDIIAKKDEDIMRLKEALILSQSQSMNGNYTMYKNNNYLNLGNISNMNDSARESLDALNFTDIGVGNKNNYGFNGNNMNLNLSEINISKDKEDEKK